MVEILQPQEPLLTTDLPPEDLQAVFDSIEDHLAFWQVLHNEAVRSQEDGLPVSLADLRAVSDWLKMSSAPLYPSQSAGGARGILYRLLNLVIKLFGSPQIQFNRELRNVLGELLLTFQEFNTQGVALKSTIKNLSARVRDLEVKNNDYQHEIQSLTRQITELQAHLNSSAEDSEPGS